MKVLCEYTPAGPHYVRTGWGRVFKACGHDFRFWNPDSKSAFDAFSEFEPDLYLGCTYSVSRAVDRCLRARPALKVALFASAWGELTDGLDRDAYPLVVASEAEKDTLRRLKAETGKPEFVFIHVTERFLEPTMGGWRSAGIEPRGLLNAADVYQYFLGSVRNELACDWFFCGGRWGYKSRNLDRYLLPLCRPDSGLCGRIFSRDVWGVPQHVGTADDDDVRDAFASAAVSLSVSEPHSTDLGFDVIERPFKALASGGMVVADYVREARDLFGEGELPMARTPREMETLVRHFVRNRRERDRIAAAGRRRVLEHHTYHHRVRDLLDWLGMPEEATRCLTALKHRLAVEQT